MLRLRRIEINNFVCFADLIVEPSVDSDKPLTVIRAENRNGKTTFLRAVRWGMYGEKGLPGDSSRFSLHPAWWVPDAEGIESSVALEFETDGSTRLHSSGAATTSTYRLVRSVTTIARAAVRDSEPDFRRISEKTQLMVAEGDGTWSPNVAGVDAVVRELLPWGLRDFFVMDADEATDYVGGGSEDKVLRHQDVIDKTTAAIHSLLGIDVFKDASTRLDGIAKGFGQAATKAIGDSGLDEMQGDLDGLRAQHTDLTERIADERTQRSDLSDRLTARQNELENELKGLGAAEQLQQTLRTNRLSSERADKDRKRIVGLLAAHLESPDLLASLAHKKTADVRELLRPLYESGRIPLKHLTFVRELLETGTCICGTDISEAGRHRDCVERKVAESAAQEERANFLGQLYEAANSLHRIASDQQWAADRNVLVQDLATIDSEISELATAKRDIDAKLDQLDEEKIGVIRDEIDTLETKIRDLNRSLAMHESKLPSLESDIDSLEKKINQRQRNERAAKDMRDAQALAKLVRQVLDRAYRTIQDSQVHELSQRMNRLFVKMAANVSDEDFEQSSGSKANIRMISEVGVRPVDGQAGQFEIFALNSRGRAMPPIEINGASRRVLALSFVLALCIESKTEAPLIADSLLNFTSGAVRRNTLRVTAESSSQPILLLTQSDLEAPSEVETIQTFCGATYTLTGQWDAVVGGEGDVVNLSEARHVALLCRCGPRQYCSICERTGQSEAAGWSQRKEVT